jgi:hypothetical protein
MYDINFLKTIESILKGQQGKWFFFPHLVDVLYSLGLDFVAPYISKMCKKFHVRKHVKLYIKAYVLIFYISSFWPKYLCIIYICMWKFTTTMRMIIICNIQYFSLKFISFNFYIWKIEKNKILCPKRVTLIMNMHNLFLKTSKNKNKLRFSKYINKEKNLFQLLVKHYC